MKPALGAVFAGIRGSVTAQWAPRLALLDLYFAYQRHPLIWASVLELRARVACDIAAKIKKLYPQLPISAAKAIGEQIGIVLTVLNDNVSYVNEKAQRRLAKECLDMLGAYVREKARNVVHNELYEPTQPTVGTGASGEIIGYYDGSVFHYNYS